MTGAREAWVKARERKRLLASLGAASGAYAVAFLVLLLLGGAQRTEAGDLSGPLLVRIGTPKGAELPAAAATLAPAVPQPSAPASTPASAPAKVPGHSASTKPSSAAPTPATSDAAPSADATAAAAPETVEIRGRENGNSYELDIDARPGVAGRSFYEPIWLFMPLPQAIPDSLYAAIPDKSGIYGSAAVRRAAFEAAYSKGADGTWRLKQSTQPSYGARPELWSALQDAGYDVANAEYKKGKALKPVTILFRISAAPDKTSGAVLEEAYQESGSGYPEIDAAVMFAFKRAQFRNSSDGAASGSFVYNF